MDYNMIKNLSLGLLGVILAVIFFNIPGQKNQIGNLGGVFQLVDTCSTASATTTYSWLTPGTGTTTLACSTASSKLIKVNLILVASSTNTVYKFKVERSMNGQDWFSDLNAISELATTSIYSAGFAENSIRVSTTSRQVIPQVGFNGFGTTSINYVNFTFPNIGENRTRLIFYQDPIDVANGFASTSNGALWASIITTDENR